MCLSVTVSLVTFNCFFSKNFFESEFRMAKGIDEDAEVKKDILSERHDPGALKV